MIRDDDNIRSEGSFLVQFLFLWTNSHIRTIQIKSEIKSLCKLTKAELIIINLPLEGNHLLLIRDLGESIKGKRSSNDLLTVINIKLLFSFQLRDVVMTWVVFIEI